MYIIFITPLFYLLSIKYVLRTANVIIRYINCLNIVNCVIISNWVNFVVHGDLWFYVQLDFEEIRIFCSLLHKYSLVLFLIKLAKIYLYLHRHMALFNRAPLPQHMIRHVLKIHAILLSSLLFEFELYVIILLRYFIVLFIKYCNNILWSRSATTSSTHSTVASSIRWITFLQLWRRHARQSRICSNYFHHMAREKGVSFITVTVQDRVSVRLLWTRACSSLVAESYRRG
jgi:hypothetical protein